MDVGGFRLGRSRSDSSDIVTYLGRLRPLAGRDWESCADYFWFL